MNRIISAMAARKSRNEERGRNSRRIATVSLKKNKGAVTIAFDWPCDCLNPMRPMALPTKIYEQANVAWLQSLTPLTPDELRQRGNHSDYADVEQKPLDLAASDAFAEEIWAVLDECSARTTAE